MQRDENPPTPADSHRLSILTREEIDELDGLPRFTDEDRQVYFGLSEPEQRVVHARTVSVAVHLTPQRRVKAWRAERVKELILGGLRKSADAPAEV